ncbi:MAG: hypothetical protein O3B84_03135 [Chloroflexi bacterium]|nr:hypothetical protein [Chloroflexota bacterium]
MVRASLRWSSQGVPPDESGRIYVVGETRGALEGAANRARQPDPFLIAFGPDGARLWVRQIEGDGDAAATAVVVDRTSGLIHVGGIHRGVTETSGFLAAFDRTGREVWFLQDGANPGYIVDLDVDPTGRLWAVSQSVRVVPDATDPAETAIFSSVRPLGRNGVPLWVRWIGPAAERTALGVDATRPGVLHVVGRALGQRSGPQQARPTDAFVLDAR